MNVLPKTYKTELILNSLAGFDSDGGEYKMNKQIVVFSAFLTEFAFNLKS